MYAKLNAGCGANYKVGWSNVDINDFGYNMVYDLNNVPWPYGNNTFDVILLQDVLEHLREPHSIIKECIRVAKHGATLIIRTPHPKSPNMHKDLDHISEIEPSFLQMTRPDWDLLYYHVQKGKPLGIFPTTYWNQTAIYRILKEEL